MKYTLEKLQDLYKMPGATMRELSQIAEKKANEKITNYKKLCN